MVTPANPSNPQPFERPDPNNAGEGTVTRRRRNPRQRVEDVAITEASGLALGGDGYPHPLEVTGGELRTVDRQMLSLLEQMLAELQAIRVGLELTGLITPLDDDDP